MSTDWEAAGAAVTAGLAARELEGQAGHAALGAGSSWCANCGAMLFGAYCHGCGQSTHLHRSLWRLIAELMHGLFFFDSKVWRTLPLLTVRPGLLTRRYIEGMRVRYISPLALFLFSVFLMFFAMSLGGGPRMDVQGDVDPEEIEAMMRELDEELAHARQALSEAEAALADADETQRDVAAQNLSEAQAEVRMADMAQRTLSGFLSGLQQGETAEGENPLARLPRPDLETGWKPLDDALDRLFEDPEFSLYRLKNTAYKWSFLLIPISLPFLWLMFCWRREVRLYDHAVFSLYSLSFMSLLFSAAMALSAAWAAAPLAGPLLLLPPLHMWIQLKETYRLGALSALWRTVALLAVAGTAFALFLLFVLTLTIYD